MDKAVNGTEESPHRRMGLRLYPRADMDGAGRRITPGKRTARRVGRRT